ncbi:DUF2089 domain-containing protein [Chloroflexota bacterium]
MPRDWQELTRLTQGFPITIERVRLDDSEVAIEGSFELPPLASLSAEDQVFIMAFVRCHGSIKEMEHIFGISYPTVKNRLHRLSEKLKLVETIELPYQEDILTQLEQDEITVQEAIERLSR